MINLLIIFLATGVLGEQIYSETFIITKWKTITLPVTLN